MPKLIVPPFNKADIESIAKGVYFDAFGDKKVAVSIDGEIKTFQDFIDFSENATSDDIGTLVVVSNLVPGTQIKLRLVALDHYDLANGKGKAHTVWMSFTQVNTYTYLGLPDDSENENLTNQGGYPTAAGLLEQLTALYDTFNQATKDAIKLVKIPTYIPRYQSSDAILIQKIFAPSATELGYSHTTDQFVPESGDGSKYDYFDEGNGDEAIAKRLVTDLDGEASDGWTRTPYLDDSYSWCFLGNDGAVATDYAGDYYGLLFAFCI